MREAFFGFPQWKACDLQEVNFSYICNIVLICIVGENWKEVAHMVVPFWEERSANGYAQAIRRYH